MSDGRSGAGFGGESLLFLTDEQLRQGIEAMFFAYQGSFAHCAEYVIARLGSV